MRQLFTTCCLVLALLMAQQNLSAQAKHLVSVNQSYYNYLTPTLDDYEFQDIFDQSALKGVELSYGRRLGGNTYLLVPVKLGLIPRSVENGRLGRDKLLGNLDLVVQNYFFKQGRMIRPFVHLGLGSIIGFDKGDLDLNIPAAAGLSFRLFPNFYLQAQSQYRFSLDNRNGWHHGIGGTVFFGGEDEPEMPADRDKDGILDLTDKCPDVPGVASAMGCPDRDGDSVADSDDKCPDVAGMVALMGCPDRDSDGVSDLDDKCPDVAGVVALMGCPDRDSDGVTDADDKCPDVKGLAAFKGCPDTDSDGIADPDDKCPREAGPASNSGCPVKDRDGDGIVDAEDACPDKKGTAAGRGCPDTDGDGIHDNEDRCPDKAGTVANKGCPDIKKEDKAKLERAVKLVQFESGKAVLLKSSYAVLDEVVSVMNTYPEYSLNINGHTDNTGDDKMNQQLSERRAKACYDYLITKGIAIGRIASAGYGETKPVGDNKTPAGRERNRRVEFELYVK